MALKIRLRRMGRKKAPTYRIVVAETTMPRDGRFVLRPWNDRKDAWNSTAFLMRNLIAPVRKAFPRVRYAHINYIDDASHLAAIVAISAPTIEKTTMTMPEMRALRATSG